MPKAVQLAIDQPTKRPADALAIVPPKAIRTLETHEEFCREIASGKSLRAICRLPGWPKHDFWTEWHRADAEAAARYARASEDRADAMGDELIELARSAMEPTIEGEDGSMRIDAARVQAIRLAYDAEKWTMSKIHRTKYGETAASTTVNVGVAVTVMPEDKRSRIMELRRAGKRAEVIDRP